MNQPVDTEPARQHRALGVKRYLYFARIEHPNEVVYAENVLDYCSAAGFPAREIIMKFNGAHRSELKECLADASAVVSTNWHLDHSCLEERPFLDAAAEAGVPVIHWMLDHPSHLWPKFVNANAVNSRFVFESSYAEAYFRKFIMPDCRSAWTVGIGPNRNSRISELTQASFRTRDFPCLVALNLRRLGGTLEEIEQKRASLPSHLRAPVTEAIELGYHDLQEPIEKHLLSIAPPHGLLDEDSRMLHHCIEIIEDAVQIRRRLKVFEIARKFPVLLQSDIASSYLPDTGSAMLEEGVTITETYRRMQRCKSVISLSVNAEIHDRTLNGLNAGSLNIIEDNKVHREIFQNRQNALLFRYDDDSLGEALDLVCSRPSRAFEIAEAGFALRDDPRLRFGGFSNFLTL